MRWVQVFETLFSNGLTVNYPDDKKREYGAVLEQQGKTEGLGEKPVSVPLCPIQILHKLPELTAFAIARSKES
jgi:hypothetical protein